MASTMTQERLVVRERSSAQAEHSRLIISAVATYADHAEIVIGRPGLPNVDADFSVGGAVLFETPEGLFEVRVMSTTANSVDVLVTHLAGRPGIVGGFVDQDGSNTPFTLEERQQISLSIEQIRIEIATRPDVSEEQLAFISKKLSEMEAASERLGRKDWINLALGTLTSIVVTAALETAAAKALFSAAGAAFSWLFDAGLKLLASGM